MCVCVPLLACSLWASFKDDIRTDTDFNTRETSFILALTYEIDERGGGERAGREGERGRE